MAGLCEGGNEPPGSLKPINSSRRVFRSTKMSMMRSLKMSYLERLFNKPFSIARVLKLLSLESDMEFLKNVLTLFSVLILRSLDAVDTGQKEPQNETDRKEKNRFLYDKTQFDYFNQRRKAIRTVLSQNKPTCKLDVSEVQQLYSSNFSQPNNNIRSEYPSHYTEAEILELDETFHKSITKSEVALSISRIAVDTAPGPDHVLMRVLKDDTAAEIISSIATRMLQTGHVPPCFQTARSVLIYKSGDENDFKNWRPTTICSVLRTVIERVLDKRLREYVKFNPHQRGFTNSPGTIVNTSLLRSILMSAKSKKCDATVVFLDISKAFDNIGHLHLSNTLDSLLIPSLLKTLILNLQLNNYTRVEINHKN
ncbi:hypothetical protein ANN_26528 [Periplaneta americana]|uniref:Reverse transcriptase domain-containing protein n=1 Tax=Periplaneta americana TaxID=6978 RepID=A0ABQ8RYE8_PERAM|nr:hypothetical protein ANN_26528 [Periplaneta americana]